MLSGVIPHAIPLAISCVSGISVYPASKASGVLCPSGQGLPEGARIRLNRTDAQIQALGLNKAVTGYLIALEHYGAFITDTTGGNQNLFAQQYVSLHQDTWTAAGLPDPYPAVAQAYGWGRTIDGAGNSYYVMPTSSIPTSMTQYLQVLDPSCSMLPGC